MSQFNSIFSPLTNKLARLAGITLLAVAALFASTQQMSAQACVQNLSISLDENCEVDVPVSMVLLGGTASDYYLKINDNNPNDDNATTGAGLVNQVSPASGWSYGVFKKSNNQLQCQGTIVVIDDFAPVFNAGAEAHWLKIDTIITWADNLDDIYNNQASWSSSTTTPSTTTWGGSLPTTASPQFYTGRPWMADPCEQIQQNKGGGADNIAEVSAGAVGIGQWLGIRTAANNAADPADSSNAFNAPRTWPDLATNAVQIKVTDYLESPQCDSQALGFHYKLRRTFQMIDKRGNDTTLNQIIYFQRSQIRGTAGATPLANTNTKATSWLSKGPGNLGQFGPFGNNPKRARLDYGSVNNFTAGNRVTPSSTFSKYGVDKMAATNGGRYSQYIDTIAFDLTNGANGCVAAPATKAEVEVVLRNLYVAIDTTAVGAQDSLSLFDPEFAQRMNYSVSFTYDGAEFPACDKGKKFQVVTSVFDWCSSTIEKDTLILKFEDSSVPTFSALTADVLGIKGATEAARITISVNTNDCSGSLRLPVKSELSRAAGFERDLGSLFNWTVNDVCSGKAVRLNYKFETRDEYNNGYYLERTNYEGRNYTVAEMNGGPVALGLPVGEHRLIIEAWDICSNETTDTLWFIVNDRVAPVMKCDDQLNVTLTSNSTSNYFLNLNASNKEKTNDQYARLTVADINEGSRDNCTLDSMFVRRVVSESCILDYLSWNMDYDIHGNNDGVVTLSDFDKIATGANAGMYYTPRHMQYVEFYCCDGGANNSGLPNSPMVELWGSDVEQPIFGPTGTNILTTNPVPSSNLNRNWSYCWATINVEDKTPPTITAPLLSKHYNADAKNWMDCTDKELIGDPKVDLPLTLVTDLADDTYTTANGKIATRGFANTRFGTPDIFGIECNGTVKYGVIKKLTCDTGIILRHWEVTKIIKSNPLTQIVVRDTQLIYVQASHDYTIQVPGDVTLECTATPTSTLTFDEDGCDLLAISKVEDKVYQAGAADGACKKVYRTWTVINWCQLPNQFTCSNADPLTFARVIPRLKSASTLADVNGIAVAAQHRFVKNNLNNADNAVRAKGGNVTNHGGSPYSKWISNPVTTTGANWTAAAVSGATVSSHRIGGTSTSTAFAALALSNYAPLTINPAGCTTGEQTFAWQYTQVIKIQDLTAPTIVGAADGGPARRFTPVDAASDDVNWVAAWNPSTYQSGLTYAESKRFTAAKEVFGIRGKMVTGDNGSSTSYSAAPPSCHALVKFTFDVKDGCTASGPFAVDNAVVVHKKTILQTTAIASVASKSFSWIGGNQVADATSNIKVNPVDYGSQTNPTGTNPTTFAVEIDNLPIDQTGGDGFVGYEEYQLLVTVRDDCGNVRVDRIDFTVADVKAPAPVCVQILKATIMPADASANKGMVVIRAVDVFQDIYRNWAAEECTGTPKATIQLLDKNGVPTGVRGETVTVTCDNLAGVQARVYLQDAAGNQDYCTVTINVEDNNSICGAAGSAAVAGAIQTESKATVEGVQVNLSGQTQKSFATGVNGLFVFNNLAAGADYTVTPSLNKGFLNGVSTFDLVLISKHILGVQPLNTPYKLIAADVNNSKSVTTLDLIQLRKLILNIDATFANNSSWRFVDATYTFPNASNPWAASFPEVKNVNDLVGSLSANFVAVKVGDVNGNAIANSTQGSVRNLTSNLGINVADMNMVAGNEYKVDFTAADLNGIEGFQFTLNLDKKGLELVDLVPGIAAEENFGIFAEEGVVTASWNGEAKGGVLFSLVVRAKSNTTLSEVLNLNSRYTAAEAYKGGEVVNVGLNFNASKASANYELYQNTPNPFAGESIIGFNLPAAGAATLTIQDVTGRTLKVINGQYAKGYNQVSLKSTELSATGVLTYTLKAADFTATRKMIIVE